MNEKLKKQLVFGTIWSLLGRVSYLLVSLVTNIILARIIGPQAFGQIGIIMFFIIIAKVLTESGLSGALIRKKVTTEDDFSTVFLFNLAISLGLFFLFLFISDYIAEIYNDRILKDLLRVTSIVLIISAFQIVNNAKLIRTLNYKKKSIIELIAVSISSVLAIIMAKYFGFGVWAVVTLQLMTALLITIQLWLFMGTLKTIRFKKDSFKSLYKFGINTTLASLLNTAFDNIYQLILAKNFAVKETGFFYQAKKLQEVPVGVIKATTLGVVFAALSKLQDDKEQFSQLYNKVTTLFTIVIGFICLLIFFYAKEVIMLLYGKEWIGSVFYMKVLIIASFFYMQEMFNRIIFKVFDRTEKILYLEIAKKTFQAITILIGVVLLRIDILLYGFLLTSIISYFINYYYSRKVFGGFSWYEIEMVLKVLVINIFIALAGYFAKNHLQINGYYSFLLFPVFIISYYALLKLLKISDFKSDFKILRNLIINKNN